MALENILNELKAKGIASAVVTSEGVITASTLAMDEIAVSNLTSFANVCDALLRRADDQQKEIEVNFANSRLVIIPIKTSYFCALVNSLEDKPLVREYALKASTELVA